MIDIKNLFYISYGGSDLDMEASFRTDSVELDTETPVYIGYYKPFDSASFQIDSVGTMAVSYEINSTAITAYDFTEDFIRDGDVQWAKPASWVAETIGGREAYWIKLSSVGSNPVTFKGIGVLFCGDKDVESVYPSALGGNISNADIRAQIYRGVTDYIMQKFVNRGFTRTANADGSIESITIHDLLRKNEVKEAASFYAVSQILRNASDSDDDVYGQHANYYQGKAFDILNSLYKLTIDLDDDGTESVEENISATKAGSIFMDFG